MLGSDLTECHLLLYGIMRRLPSLYSMAWPPRFVLGYVHSTDVDRSDYGERVVVGAAPAQAQIDRNGEHLGTGDPTTVDDQASGQGDAETMIGPRTGS